MAVKIVDGSSVHKNFDGILKAFLPYAKKKLGYDKPVNIQLVSDAENAKDPFGKTAYYDPNQMKVTVFVDKRHVKDILRSISHELVHHKQNCQGKLYSPAGEGYAQNDPHLREMEAEAYLEGNGFLVRDFEDQLKGDEEMKKNVLDETIKKAVKKILSEIADLAEQEDPDAGMGAVQNPEGGDLASKLEAVVGADKVAEVMALLGDAGLDLSMVEGGKQPQTPAEKKLGMRSVEAGRDNNPNVSPADKGLEEKMKKDSPDRRPSDTPADRLRPLEEKDDKEDVEDPEQYSLRTAKSVGEEKPKTPAQKAAEKKAAEKKKKQVAKDEGLKEDMHEEDEDVKEGPAVYMQENWVRKPLNERIYKTLIKKWCK
jgi:hypothetical protein